MNFRRVMLAAPKSGSGKTTITCALLQALKQRGQRAVSYKCGPDYIDPMFHRQVIGIPSKNLDTFFTGEEETRRLFLKNRTDADFAVLEGVMGLFDGLGGIREEGSSYHLAKVTKTPVILVVDAKGMGRSVLPLIAGFLAYDTERLIRGVILNRMSGAYYEILKPVLEKELNIAVLGYFPEHKKLQIAGRHLGLILPNELQSIQEQLRLAAAELEKTVSVAEIMRIAEGAQELEEGGAATAHSDAALSAGVLSKAAVSSAGVPAKTAASSRAAAPVIAVARDEAFCFYYEDNLQLLQESGARLVFFSPLHDGGLPKDCDGLLIGGGYPELYAGKLSENTGMLAQIREAAAGDMPIVAECGGFLYLQKALTDREGNSYPMAGALPSVCYDTGKSVRFGYIELEERQSSFLPPGGKIRGHEFHYFDSSDNGADCIAAKPVSGKSYSCVVSGEHHWMGFPHLYYPSNPAFAQDFVRKAAAYRERKGK